MGRTSSMGGRWCSTNNRLTRWDHTVAVAAPVAVRGQGRVRRTRPAADRPSEPGRVLDRDRGRNPCRPGLLHSAAVVGLRPPNISVNTTRINIFPRRRRMPVVVLRTIQWRCKRRPSCRGWRRRRTSTWGTWWVDRVQVQAQLVRITLHLAVGVLVQQQKTPPRWRGRYHPSRRHLRRHPSLAVAAEWEAAALLGRNTSAGATGVSSPSRSRRIPSHNGGRDVRPNASRARRSIGGSRRLLPLPGSARRVANPRIGLPFLPVSGRKGADALPVPRRI